MSGIARLFDGNEARAMADMIPCSELDHRLRLGLACAFPQIASPDVRCAICEEPIGGYPAYVVIMLPVDPEVGVGVSGGVCSSCGGLPRIQLEAHMTKTAILMFEPHAGRA